MTRRNGSGLTRVLLVAASAVRRAGLETLIKGNPALKLVGSLENINSSSSYAAQLSPDVILLDLEHPTRLPSAATSIVILVDEPPPDWAARVLRQGVKAILPRDAAAAEINDAIHAARGGMVLLDPDLAMALASRIPDFPDQGTMLDDLTPRELEVLCMLAEGLGNRQIASRLGITSHTVKFHISSILDKLGASSRTEAVTMGIRAGMILL